MGSRRGAKPKPQPKPAPVRSRRFLITATGVTAIVCLVAALWWFTHFTGHSAYGTVKVNKVSLPAGYIFFIPESAPETKRGTTVRQGRYELTGLGSGRHRVVLMFPKDLSEQLDFDPERPPEESVHVLRGPQLVVDVTQSNRFDFDLKQNQ